VLPNLDIENNHTGIIAGIDEVGRGCYSGPVLACCYVLDRHKIPHGINDSKKISTKKREIIYNQIKDTATYGIGMCSVEEIDKLNILQASLLAMQRAYEQVVSKANIDIALVDGNKLPTLPCKMQAVIDGDAKFVSIAIASVIAKVTRDKIMDGLHIKYPHYAWDKNKGYGTKAHRDGLLTHGVTEYHRKSFAPIAKLLNAA